MFLLVACFHLAATASKYEAFVWHTGYIQLNNNTRLQGTIGFDHTQEVLILETAEGIRKAFSPQKVAYFGFYDEYFENDRIYVTLEMENRNGYVSRGFFEVLMDGPLAVLRREKKYANIRMVLTTDHSGHFSRHAACFDYYIYQGGEFTTLDDFQEYIYPMMLQNNEEKISRMVNESELNLRYMKHKIMVVDYYNSLHGNAGQLNLVAATFD